MLVKLENNVPVQWPVTEAHVQATNPDTSFSFPITEEMLNRFGYAKLHFSDPVQYDVEWQEAKQITPAFIDGKWMQQWEIVEKYSAEEKARIQQEAAATDYKIKRAFEYPPIGDQLDALFHAGVFPPDMAAKIQAVKDKYPKG